MAARRGLGKGLDSLIAPKAPSQAAPGAQADSAIGSAGADSVVQVPIDDVEPNRAQPRKHFEEAGLQELADSIGQHGVLQPLLVRRQADYYEIIAGERRWRAAKLAKLKTVPVLIKEVSDRERNEIALIENLQREDLDPLEEAAAYRQLIDDYGLKQDEVAVRVSKSRSAVTNSLRLLKLDGRVQEMLQTQQISVGHARALLAVKQGERQFEIAQQIVAKGLSVRDTEKIVQDGKHVSGTTGTGSKSRKKKDVQKDAVYRKLEEQLRTKLGTKVEILDNDGKGKIEISYYSPDELERLLEILQG